MRCSLLVVQVRSSSVTQSFSRFLGNLANVLLAFLIESLKPHLLSNVLLAAVSADTAHAHIAHAVVCRSPHQYQCLLLTDLDYESLCVLLHSEWFMPFFSSRVSKLVPYLQPLRNTVVGGCVALGSNSPCPRCLLIIIVLSSNRN